MFFISICGNSTCLVGAAVGVGFLTGLVVGVGFVVVVGVAFFVVFAENELISASFSTVLFSAVCSA